CRRHRGRPATRADTGDKQGNPPSIIEVVRMKPNGRRLGPLGPVGLVVALLAGLLGLQAATATAAHADTSQFHGVNWADPNDNFVTGNITPVGLSNTDDYATTYAKATSVLKGFKALGANTVRMGFNNATVTGSWWN